MAGWILKSSDPEMTLRLPANGIKTVGRSARAEFIVDLSSLAGPDGLALPALLPLTAYFFEITAQ